VKTLFWLWAVFLLVILTADAAAYFVVRNRLSQSLELALDGAIVGSISEEDLIFGRQSAGAARAQAVAWELLKGNMAGPLADSLTLQFELLQENEQIMARGRASVRTRFLLASLTGGGAREIIVNKTLRYQGLYK
jgi:hypothetical protein